MADLAVGPYTSPALSVATIRLASVGVLRQIAGSSAASSLAVPTGVVSPVAVTSTVWARPARTGCRGHGGGDGKCAAHQKVTQYAV